MTGILLGLSLLAIAVTIQRIALRRRARLLRERELSFRFHAVRDALQMLVADGRLSTDSRTYSALMAMTNLAIKNCGSMKLKHVVRLASEVDEAVTKQTLKEIKMQDEEVQELAGHFFMAFALMLVNNDWVVRQGVRVAQVLDQSWSVIRPAVVLFDTMGASVVNIVSPTRAEAVRKARVYLNRSDHLATAA